MVNVVIVNDYAHVNGGAGQVALASARGLAQRGHKVVLLSAVLPIEPGFNDPNLTIVCTGQHEILKDPSRLRAAAQGIWNPTAARAMTAVLDQLERTNTVVHFHGWTKALSASVIRAAARRQFALVTTLHDYFAACPNGGFFNYQTQSICHLTPLGLACIGTHCDARSYGQKLWRVARQAVQKNIGGFPATIGNFVSLSEVSLTALRPSLPTAAPIHRIANPTIVEQGAPVDVVANTRFAYVGRLAAEKGGVLFARAAQAQSAAALFIGEGSERAAIQDACATATITGWLDAGGVRAALATARALVLPSLWYEGQPLVVGDAAAMGIAAIVPDTCAAREAVIDGETGLWFKGADQQDLQRKIGMLQNDPALARRLGHAAYERYWRAPPTLARHLDALESLYRTILAK